MKQGPGVRRVWLRLDRMLLLDSEMLIQHVVLLSSSERMRGSHGNMAARGPRSERGQREKRVISRYGGLRLHRSLRGTWTLDIIKV